MRSPEEKIVAFSDIEAVALSHRRQGRKVVTTNGCFDILHWGHIRYLAEARALGDVLIVGLNSDASVRGLKGPTRPVFSQDIRARQMAALESVDHVVIFDESRPDTLLERVRPDIHVKGGDYRPEQLPEREVVERGGGRVECLSLVPGYSTTGILEKLKLLSDEQTGSQG